MWSCADKLTDDATRHWTHVKHPLTSLLRVDGKKYRIMGDEPKSVPPMEQVGLFVLPTRTLYGFKSPEVEVDLTFMTPALPDDLEVLSRPLTYITWEIRSADGKPHAVDVYFGAGAEIAVHSNDQAVTWLKGGADAVSFVRVGTEDQPVLERAGDETRIDWGYCYVGASGYVRQSVAPAEECVNTFLESGRVPRLDDIMPRPVRDKHPTLATVLAIQVPSQIPASRTVMIAYDDEWSMNYFGRKLRPYWRKTHSQAMSLLRAADKEFEDLKKRCKTFDDTFISDLVRVGGPKYAMICSLAYRECLAGNKLCADDRGMPMLFPKENTSNGCVSTVDVIYPMEPLFLLINPMLAKASLVPVLNYTASPLWTYKYAPHDLGTYPHATRQVYGGDDPAHEGDRMPVEESGNMILLLAAVAKAEGKPDFAAQFWPQVTQWAQYLEAKGFDPENQLCTDDFAGHLAHNANLSVKAIVALGAYGMLCEMRGDKEGAKKYHDLAVEMAQKWVKAADDGDHFRLAFDKAGSWSQKYNLIWDKLLGLNVFPPDVLTKEMAFYIKTRDQYGLALDNRQPYAKLDWSIWTASMAPNRSEFDALVDPIFDFLNHNPDRNPMTDWYWTKKGSETGFHARPVVGGVFIKMLTEPATWKKWAFTGPTLRGKWAPLPTPPEVREIVADARKAPVEWKYTTQQPAPIWMEERYDASTWKAGSAPFGSPNTPGISPRTDWRTGDIWMRREFTLTAGHISNLQVQAYHDEDIEVYINGALAAKASGYTTSYVLINMRQAAKTALRNGKNLIAVHCHQTGGGQGVDVGLVDVFNR